MTQAVLTFFSPSIPQSYIPQFILIWESIRCFVYLQCTSHPQDSSASRSSLGVSKASPGANFTSVPTKGTLVILSGLRRELLFYVFHTIGRNLVISDFDLSNDVTVELLYGATWGLRA